MPSNTQEILDERGTRYGEFPQHAGITQRIKLMMKDGRSWDDCTYSQKEALEMIAHKIGRIVNGDPDYQDSWDDIAGYAVLASQEIASRKPQQTNIPTNG